MAVPGRCGYDHRPCSRIDQRRLNRSPGLLGTGSWGDQRQCSCPRVLPYGSISPHLHFPSRRQCECRLPCQRTMPHCVVGLRKAPWPRRQLLEAALRIRATRHWTFRIRKILWLANCPPVVCDKTAEQRDVMVSMHGGKRLCVDIYRHRHHQHGFAERPCRCVRRGICALSTVKPQDGGAPNPP